MSGTYNSWSLLISLSKLSSPISTHLAIKLKSVNLWYFNTRVRTEADHRKIDILCSYTRPRKPINIQLFSGMLDKMFSKVQMCFKYTLNIQ